MTISNNKAFTLIELIVVISIVGILSTISFISFQSSIIDSRDATRIADMTNLKVALKSFKQKSGAYPDPGGNLISLTNSGTVYVLQGFLDNSVSLDNLQEIPKDPKSDTYYLYSVTANKQEFEIGMTLENGRNIAYNQLISKAIASENNTAFIDGDYKTVAKNIFPSLILAISGSGNVEIQDGIGSGSENRNKFILNGSRLNLPYNIITGLPVATATSFTGIINENGVTVPLNTTYPSCADINISDKYMGYGSYEIKSDYGKTINNTCDCSSGTNTGSCLNHDNTLVGYWDMQSLDSGKLRDLSGNGNDGTMSGTTSTGGKLGSARYFDGVNDQINFGTGSLLNKNVSDLTIIGLVKLTFTLGTEITNYYIFSNELHLSYGYMLRLQDTTNLSTSGKIGFRTNNFGVENNLQANSNTYPNDNLWHLVTLTKKGTVGTIYLDGNKISDYVINDQLNGPTDSTQNSIIGSPTGTQNFKGNIDELRIYNRALSDGEVKDYYEATK